MDEEKGFDNGTKFAEESCYREPNIDPISGDIRERVKEDMKLRELCIDPLSGDTRGKRPISTPLSVDIERNVGVSTYVSVDTNVPDLDEMMNRMKMVEERERKVGSSSKDKRIPFPKERHSRKQVKEYERFNQALQAASLQLPISVTIKEMPRVRKFVRSVIGNEEEITRVYKESADDFNTYEALVEATKILEKRNDPGQFTIPCSIGGYEINGALADTGANINVASQSVLESMGITRFEPHTRRVVLADSTRRKPKGIVRDVQLLVEGWIVPTDFVVVETVLNEQVPLVLGRPFLATVGARINFDSMTIIFTKLRQKVYPLEHLDDVCGALYSDDEADDEESVGENMMDEVIDEPEDAAVLPIHLCQAVLLDEKEETNQEDMVLKYHVFTEMLEECLINDPNQEDRYKLLLKALHKVIPKLPIFQQRRKVAPLKAFLTKFFSDLDEAKRVFDNNEDWSARERRRNHAIHSLPHRRMDDSQALNGDSLNALFTVPQREEAAMIIPPANHNLGNQGRERAYPYRIPSLTTQAEPNERVLLLKPHAFYDGSVHYRVMNRRGNLPFTHVSARLNEENMDADTRADLLNNPIKIILSANNGGDAQVHRNYGSTSGSH